MSSSQGNVFLTTENLAFSMPLILVCATYAYFTLIPLKFGLPILAGLFVLYQIKAQIQAQRDKKLQNMDEKTMNELALELEGEGTDASDTDEKAKAIAKKKAAIQTRLAAEARKEAKRSKGKKNSDDDDDDVALDTFVKGSRGSKKAN